MKYSREVSNAREQLQDVLGSGCPACASWPEWEIKRMPCDEPLRQCERCGREQNRMLLADPYAAPGSPANPHPIRNPPPPRDAA